VASMWDQAPRRLVRELVDAPPIVRPLLARWEYDLRWSLEALGPSPSSE